MPGGTDQTLRPFLWRAEQLYPETKIVSRTATGKKQYTYSEYARRIRTLASALDRAGIESGDRVGTVCWNHHRHFETYFAVPSMGAQLHTINPLLPADHIRYIVESANDRILFVDPSLLDALEAAVQSPAFSSVEQYVVMGQSTEPAADLDLGDTPVTDYASFIGSGDAAFEWPSVHEDQPAGLCYTSGTTGKPKGVEYTQGMLWSHTMASQTPQGIPVTDSDVVMPVVPMFHVNAWGLPFTATAGGAAHVYPGPSPDPADIAHLIEEEAVTVSAGVPTVWLGLQEYMSENPVDLSSLERIIVGGAAAPRAMIEWFEGRDVELLHAWGMTEMAPIGSVSHLKQSVAEADRERQLRKRSKQGLMVPGIEFRVIDEDGEEVPWDGESFGELRVRGPWVTTEYFDRPDATTEEFSDGWLKTGDVVSIDEDGYIEIVDRAKDVIKSGGEWISSLELENAIMAHESVTEAAVIGVSHEKWQERPIACIVAGENADHSEIETAVMALLDEKYPDWWLPDDVVFIESIPKTATGKFSKKDLREQYTDTSQFGGEAPEHAAPDDS